MKRCIIYARIGGPASEVECFNEALPYEAGQSYGDRAASQVRVIYRIS